MSGIDWTSLPKYAYNWIGDGILSYFAAMKEIIDNTLGDSVYNILYNIRVWNPSDGIPVFLYKIAYFFINATKLLFKWCFQTDIDTGFTYFLHLFATAVFGVFGLAIAFYMVFLAIKFLLWLCFGRRVIHVKLEDSDSNRHQNANGLKRGSGDMLECHRWLKQAMNDLESARNDFEGDLPAPEWVCFKCHQSMEKLLKAYIIHQNASVGSTSHNLVELASQTGDTQLKNIARRLHGMLGDTSRMRYPDSVPPPMVPRDVYSLRVAVSVHELTEEALEYASRLLGIRL